MERIGFFVRLRELFRSAQALSGLEEQLQQADELAQQLAGQCSEQ